MNSARNRTKRLARLARIRRLDARVAENRALAAQAQVDAANAHVDRVRSILADTVTPRGQTSVAMLAGAAGLRGLLQSALDRAMDDARDKARTHSDKVRLHVRAEARADHLQDSLNDSTRAAELEDEEKEQADHVPRRPRKDRT